MVYFFCVVLPLVSIAAFFAGVFLQQFFFVELFSQSFLHFCQS
jgi:hypothetical protein